MHVRRRVGSLPVPSEARIVLTAVVGVGGRERQGCGILVIGVSCCTHSIRIGKDPASHWNRREGDRETRELPHHKALTSHRTYCVSV